jgi:hypothetical protein
MLEKDVMHIDPEKAYKEKMLIKEIERLDGLLYDNDRDQTKDINFDAKVCDALDRVRKDLNELWREMRADHRTERKQILNLLIGIFWALVIICVLLFFRH